jgi:hypothetical protein
MLMILLAHAELDGLICSGESPTASTPTRSWASACRTAPARRAEALAELALRYFTGHGRRPNGTSPTGRRSHSPTCAPAWQQVRDRLARSSTTGAPSGTPPAMPPRAADSPRPTSCRSSTRHTAATRTPAGCSTPPGTCPAPGRPRTGMALADAQLIAAMRRTVAPGHSQFDLRPYRALTPPRSRPSTRPPDGTASTCGSRPGSPCT